MGALLKILGLLVVLAAIAPVAMAGGRMIAAFMMRKHMLVWMAITVGAMIGVVAGGMLAVQVLQPMLSETLGPFSSLAMLAPPWAIFLLGRRWADGASPDKAAP